MWETVTFGPATAKGKRLKAVFKGDGKQKTINFGSKGGSAYPDHKNDKTKAAWIARHKVREDWTVPDNAGSLSRWILWGDSTSIAKNITAFKKKFGLK